MTGTNSSFYLSMNSGAIGLLLVGIGVAAARAIWHLYLSPLARQRIPGPKRAAVSDFWHYWVQLRRRRTFAFHDAFEVSAFDGDHLTTALTGNVQRYGPVVRTGPNRVAFRNIDTVKILYSSHDFRKSNYSNVLTFGGFHNMFSTKYVDCVLFGLSYLIADD